MSWKIDTNGSLCFNAAAGCISRHQLVQFHNRMGPGAQWGLRCTMWQHKCHNFSFLTVQFFVIFCRPAVCSSVNTKLRQSSSSENSVRLLNGVLFTPDSSMRKVSSSKPELLRSYTDTALTGLTSNGCCSVSVHTDDDTVTHFIAQSLYSEMLYLKK